LNIVIEDDSPRAVDVNGGTLRESSEEQTHDTFLGGNVLANILHDKALVDSDSAGWGADGPQGGLGNVLFGNPVQWSGEAKTADGDLLSDYGKLRLNSDGSWSFKLDNGKEATQQLAQGDSKTLTVEYTITDSDGDTSTAELSI